eukprot:scaffold36751_cov20-Tisochrysis_lutea.AAC.9
MAAAAAAAGQLLLQARAWCPGAGGGVPAAPQAHAAPRRTCSWAAARSRPCARCLRARGAWGKDGGSAAVASFWGEEHAP